MAWILRRDSFLQITQQSAVLTPSTLLDEIADDVSRPPVRYIDFITACPVFFGQPVVQDVIYCRAAFQKVSRNRTMGIVEAKRKRGRMPDVKIVRLAVVKTVVLEFRVLDQNVAPSDVAFQDAFLIVVEIAVAHRKVNAGISDACAIFIRHNGAGKLDVLNESVITGRNPDTFSLRILARGSEMRASIDAPQGQIICRPGAHVSAIEGSVDFDHISWDSRGDGGTRGLVRPLPTDPQRCGVRRRTAAGKKNQHERGETRARLHPYRNDLPFQ